MRAAYHTHKNYLRGLGRMVTPRSGIASPIVWRRLLRRRSQKDRMTWNRSKKLADDFLPQARILHPWPHVRFAVKHPRWEPSALIGHARICAGGAQ